MNASEDIHSTLRINHTHKHKMLTYTDVEFPSAQLKHLSILPVLLCLLFGMDGGEDVQMLMSPTARLLSRWRPSCWALLWILSASWRPQTEIKTQNALQELTLCRVVLHPEFCSFLVNTKAHFCSSCSSLGRQTPPEASRFLNSYILYLYHCCASSLHLNDAKNTFIYFVGLIVWSHLTGTVFSLTCFSKIAQKLFFFGTSSENSLSHSNQPTSSGWEIKKRNRLSKLWDEEELSWCSFISTDVSC